MHVKFTTFTTTKPVILGQSVADSCKKWLAVGLCALLAACSGTTPVDPTENWTAERLYNEAKDEMNTGNWPQAIKHLKNLETRYPFGVYSQQAQLDMAYSYWKDSEPALALQEVYRFMELYPNHPATDYALYLVGVINFYRDRHALAELTEQDPSERDSKGARESYTAFKELVTRFPKSSYAADALERMDFLVEGIARNENIIARYYFKRGAYVAAVNRAQTVVTDFQGTAAIEEALYIMHRSYEALNLPELSDASKRVLELNYPSSKYFTEGIPEEKKPWWQIF